MKFDMTKTNVGTTDRLIRFLLGALLIYGAFRSQNWVSGVIGAVLIGTAYLRVCPAYKAFGFSTDKGAADADTKELTAAGK